MAGKLTSCNNVIGKVVFLPVKKLKSTKGRPPFEVNIRTVLTFREISKAHTAIKKYCGFMNMLKSINDSAYAGIVSRLTVAYKDIANASMSIAAEDIRNENIDTMMDDTNDIDISADGAWQRRGFASLNGIATIMAVDIGKCLDYEVLTKECKACQVWESKKKSSIEYDNFMVDHDCLLITRGLPRQWSLQEYRSVSNVLYKNIIYDTRLISDMATLAPSLQ